MGKNLRSQSLQQAHPCAVPQEAEVALNQALLRASAGVHGCLLDSINLAGAMEALLALVREGNRYLDEREGGFAASPPGAEGGLLQNLPV